MSNPLLNARQDRAALLTEILSLTATLETKQAEVAKIDAFLEMYQRYAGDADAPEALSPQSQPPLANLKHMTIHDACVAIMRNQGGTARMVDMVKVLERAGKLKSSSHRGNYGSVVQTLQRFPSRFRKTEERGVWQLIDSFSEPDEPPARLLALR
jgi:hypothetical protein